MYIKTAVSLPEPLFEQVEALARERHLSRSRFVALALEDFIRRQYNRRLLEQTNAAYEDSPDPEEQALLDQWRRYQAGRDSEMRDW